MRRRGPSGPARLLCADKPAGPTSFDVVRQVRRTTGEQKIGHAGTLDPFASGLLILGLGPATRLLGLLSEGDKQYEATVAFGAETDTCDPTGRVVHTSAVPVDADALSTVLPRFVGAVQQIPPQYSAVRIDGRRSYDRARAGEDFEMPVRTVHVHAIDVLDLQPPHLHLRIRCSGGTYIRSLARDLGRALGTRAHLLALRRESVGPFTLDDAVPMDAIAQRWKEGTLTLDPVELVRDWPRLVLDPEQVGAVRHGRQPDRSWWSGQDWTHLPARVALLDATGRLVAVAEAAGAERLELSVVLPPEGDAPEHAERRP